jgi:hypothetical protein
MATVNTKLFTSTELNHKKYYDLIILFEGLIKVSMYVEDSIEEIEMIEQEDGFLDCEMQHELNLLITQFDYITKNILTVMNVLKKIENEAFFFFNGDKSFSLS